MCIIQKKDTCWSFVTVYVFYIVHPVRDKGKKYRFRAVKSVSKDIHAYIIQIIECITDV